MLNKNGFIFRGSDQEAQLLYIVQDEVNPSIVKSHIHVVVFDSKVWKNYIVFRDFLRNNKETAKRYELLKTELAAKYKDDIQLLNKNLSKKFLKNKVNLYCEKNELEKHKAFTFAFIFINFI